jgi:hypothetical protein
MKAYLNALAGQGSGNAAPTGMFGGCSGTATTGMATPAFQVPNYMGNYVLFNHVRPPQQQQQYTASHAAQPFRFYEAAAAPMAYAQFGMPQGIPTYWAHPATQHHNSDTLFDAFCRQHGL